MPNKHEEGEEDEHSRWELGNMTKNEKIKDFIILFILTYFLTRNLTPGAIAIMFVSVFAFHYFQRVTYHVEPRPGFNSLHLKYFIGTYLFCVAYLQVYKYLKGRQQRKPIRQARLTDTPDKSAKI